MVFSLSEEDLLHEEAVLQNPNSVKAWWRYLISKSEASFKDRFVIYERALKALPGSYKLWYAYLRERLDFVSDLCVTDPQYEILNNTFERALVTMHNMPRIWLLYLQTLISQRLITRTRKTFDRALSALPATQHGRIWESYLEFVNQEGVPVETSIRVYRRYLSYDPSHIEDFIEFLLKSGRWQESAEYLASVLNGQFQFQSSKGKSIYSLWMDLLEVVVNHANEVSGLDVEAIIRGGIAKFTDEVGMLWTCLADYYIRKNMFEKARDIYEEGMVKVVTVRDFSVIFDAYSRFEESCVAKRLEEVEEGGEEYESEVEDEEDVRVNTSLSLEEMQRKVLRGYWLNDGNDVDLRLARWEELMNRRPALANSVLLRQNPHNVEQWHRRVKLFEGDAEKQILTYTEAVRTVDPMKAIGKSPHTLWVAFAKLYETHNDLVNARVVLDKAVQVNYKTVDHLAYVWCEWAEMELRQNNSKGALELMRRATAAPSVEVRNRVADVGKEPEPVQLKLYKSPRLWSLYVDLEESVGTLESTRSAYERILELRIATPQIILNYAQLLEENNYFEEAFKVYERSVKMFKYPHVKDIWLTYLTKFVKRYGKTKVERARELFENAVSMVSSSEAALLYLEYAKFEEDYGLSKRAMDVYKQATRRVADEKKLEMYEIYIAHTAERFGAQKTREIFQEAIESSGLAESDVKMMCIRFAELEKSMGEVDRARAVYKYASQFADPQVWQKWHDLEIEHGNKDTYREMLRIKRTVSCCVLSPPAPVNKSQSLSDTLLSQFIPPVKKARSLSDTLSLITPPLKKARIM
ncbi:Tetratricopeptide-like helical domain superfamily [Arabidopsis suecica]|uniref:Tetratricopeptide-like helical domain superfamily n=1 Tax=Arabidopsis suecica TaxID=45249 RepID=A0A8T2BMM8_ARASU|nr:Tetratricopeptide-like helical domain superfamily [Arabidopsis suecica]